MHSALQQYCSQKIETMIFQKLLKIRTQTRGTIFDHLGDQKRKIEKISNYSRILSGQGKVVEHPLTCPKVSLHAYTTPTNIENIPILGNSI